MNLLEIQNQIYGLMSTFVTQIKGATAMERTDINRVSETVLIPLFVELYGYKDLKNLNHSEGPNYPAVDLGDEIARAAFQITATSTSKKIQDTLQKFVDHALYKKYDRLIVYVLTEKRNSYSGTAYKRITGDKFVFDAGQDILDYRDVLKEVSAFQIDKARKILNILEANFVEGKTLLPPPQMQIISPSHFGRLDSKGGLFALLLQVKFRNESAQPVLLQHFRVQYADSWHAPQLHPSSVTLHVSTRTVAGKLPKEENITESLRIPEMAERKRHAFFILPAPPEPFPGPERLHLTAEATFVRRSPQQIAFTLTDRGEIEQESWTGNQEES